jgi:fatty acid desaturase
MCFLLLALASTTLVMRPRCMCRDVSRQRSSLSATIASDNHPDPLLVRCAGKDYDLSNFRHPGGHEVIARHAGTDITHLFFSNHFSPDLNAISKYEISTSTVCDESLDESSELMALSPEFMALKRDVHSHLEAAGIEWRHKFRYHALIARLCCLIAACCSRRGFLLPEAAGFGVAMAYGFLTGRCAWTHAHNGVHNPARIPPALRLVLSFDLVLVIDAWMAEHHAHHAHTNDAHRDPDVRWWMPLFSYADLASGEAHARGVRTRLLAACAYPFLVPVMLVRSLRHAVQHDPAGWRTLAGVLLIAPIRFGIDVWLLGPRPFLVALATATLYILATFVATHQVADNHAFEPSDCWMARQLKATNNVWPQSRFYSFLCGGINCHVEHHLFPMVSSEALPQIAPVVEAFAIEHGLPYNALSPLQLARRHFAFLKPRPRAGADQELA